MNEPAATIVVNAAVTASTTAGGFFVMGASTNAIVLGFIGAFAATMWMGEFDQPKKTYGGIAVGMLLAGWGTPAATDFALAHEVISKISAENIKLLMPLVIGASIPLFGAPLVAMLRRWLGAK